MKYIVMDPSGSFYEGKGHTGVCILDDDDWENMAAFSIAASDFRTLKDYWKAHMDIITAHPDATFIIESFMIRNTGFLIGKMPETIQLIGAMRYELEKGGQTYTFQTPTLAKSRFTDAELMRHVPGLTYNDKTNRYYLNGKLTNDHMRDAMKHLLYFKKYKEPKMKGD